MAASSHSRGARAIPRLALVFAAVLFSTGGAGIKSCGLSPWQVASFRSGIAALTVLAILPEARRRWTWRMLLVSAAHAGTMILFVQANRLTTAASTIFLQSTAPLYVLLLSPVLLQEPIRGRDVAFMAVLALGMGLFFVGIEPPAITAPDPLSGNVLAVASGLTWALTVMGLRWRATQPDEAGGSPAAAVVGGNVLACIACLPLALPVAEVQLADVLVLVFLGVFQVGLAYVLLSVAIRHVPALEVSLLLLLEPVLNPAWAWLLHGETSSAWSLLGAAVILLATVLKTWREQTAGR